MILSDIAEKYPEAPVIVAMAESTWAGNRKVAKIEFSLKIEGTLYLASIERGNNQIGVITFWKKNS